MTYIKTIVVMVAVALCVGVNLQAATHVPTEVATKYTTIHLSEQASVSVKKDKTRAQVRLTLTDRSEERVQLTLNTRIKEAIMGLPDVDGIEVTTQGYYVNNDPRKQRRGDSWEASQEIVIEGRNNDAISSMVRLLQEKGLHVVGTYHYASKEQRKKVQADLISTAIKNVKEKASLIAKGLGLNNIHLSEVRVNEHTGRVFSMDKMAMGAEATSADPVLEGGNEEVRVAVSVTVLLN